MLIEVSCSFPQSPGQCRDTKSVRSRLLPSKLLLIHDPFITLRSLAADKFQQWLYKNNKMSFFNCVKTVISYPFGVHFMTIYVTDINGDTTNMHCYF